MSQGLGAFGVRGVLGFGLRGGMTKRFQDLDNTKSLMGALVRMKPKPHEKMKLGKSKTKKGKSPGREGVRAKRSNR